MLHAYNQRLIEVSVQTAAIHQHNEPIESNKVFN